MELVRGCKTESDESEWVRKWIYQANSKQWAQDYSN